MYGRVSPRVLYILPSASISAKTPLDAAHSVARVAMEIIRMFPEFSASFISEVSRSITCLGAPARNS